MREYSGVNVTGHVLRSHIVYGILATILITVADCCPKCTSDDMDSVKVECQAKGQDLHDAETSQNSTIVCSALHQLFVCVGSAVPQCLEMIGGEYEPYRWTPWDCHLSQHHVHVYQELVNNGCQLEVEINRQLNLQDANQSAHETSSHDNFAKTIHSTCLPAVTSAIVASLVLMDLT